MVEYQTVSIVFTGLSVSLAAFYYIITLRNTEKNQKQQLDTRQAQLSMQLHQMTQTKEYLGVYQEIMTDWNWTDYDDFLQKYGYKNDIAWDKFGVVFSVWEQVGILVKHGVFDPEMMYDMWGGYYRRLWEKIEPIVFEYNLRHGGGFLEYAEDLYYYFQEAKLKERMEFVEREEKRHRKRAEFGLSPRPVYKKSKVNIE